MKFKPLDEEYKQYALPQYELDEDIDISMGNEKTSEVEVAKQRARWAQMEKKEAEQKAAEDKLAKEKEALEAEKLKKNLKVEEGEKKEKAPAEEKAKPQKAEKKEEAPKEKPVEKEAKKEKAVEKAPAEEKKETKEEAKPAAKPAKEEAAPKEEGKVVKPAPEKPKAAMMQTSKANSMRIDGEEIEITDLDDDDEIAR